MTMFDNYEAYLAPIWNGDLITDESIMPLYKKGESGELTISLANEIKRVVCVKTATLDRKFVEGKDYLVRDGKLVIPSGSDIRIMPWEEYNPENGTFICKLGGYLAFGEGNHFHSIQYAVTYEPAGNVFEGRYVPVPSPMLAKSREKLTSDGLRLAFYGDSITYGCNASGLGNGVPPYMPIYPMLAYEGLKRRGCKLEYYNPSIGGRDSNWGRACSDFYFGSKVPDLTVIAFGMNDGTGNMPIERFIANTESIVKFIRSRNKDAEFILISTTLPNPLSTFCGLQEAYEEPLKQLAEREKCAFLNITDLHRTLMTRKEYYHMTGNNINHPTDFLARVYAQGILALLGM